jgi:hypothetical protein
MMSDSFSTSELVPICIERVYAAAQGPPRAISYWLLAISQTARCRKMEGGAVSYVGRRRPKAGAFRFRSQ